MLLTVHLFKRAESGQKCPKRERFFYPNHAWYQCVQPQGYLLSLSFKMSYFYLYFVEVPQGWFAFACVSQALHSLEAADFFYTWTETSDK